MAKQQNTCETRRAVFDNWIKKHKGLLLKVTRAYSFTPEDREDLFQEIALRIWNSIPNFKYESKEATWIYRVSLFTAMEWTKREKRGPKRLQPDSTFETALLQNEATIDKRVEWLYEQIATLDEIDRSILLLMLEGFTYAEMADMMGISAGNVGVRINRAKKQLATKEFEKETHGI